MDKLRAELSQLRKFNAQIRGAMDEGAAPQTESTFESESVEALDQAFTQESIILRQARPVLAIKENQTQLSFVDADDLKIWKAPLEKAKPQLEKAIRSVGRIELKGGDMAWVGTGWLVADNIMVTNRHVADAFAMWGGQGFVFRMGSAGPIKASIDFLQEIDNQKTLIFKLTKVLYISEEPNPDVAFFEVEVGGGNEKLATPIGLSAKPAMTDAAATIGYPAYDSRIPEPELMEKIYGKIYNKKRLAPGAVTKIDSANIHHNCTTLGGNSGSVVLDMQSGDAIGLHFSGSFLKTNYAVRSDVVKDLLSRVRSGNIPRRSPSPETSAQNSASLSGNQASITIPLTVTVSIGSSTAAVSGGTQDAKPRSPIPFPAGGDGGDIPGVEGVAADYSGRKGYQPNFLGNKYSVELPSPEKHASDVLEFKDGGKKEYELRYQHYSVVMSRSRRMCFFSAVNIDGELSKTNTKRAPWKWDPRIPKAQQIMNECYGNPPRFSRGHMTRREDPIWGTDSAAKLGNVDSMHVTNVTSQMQAFNSPIWLALENYALQHAREDDMKISVFTGPYFSEEDPERYGVKIPVAFWKVIAFIHDDTKKLCATGYEMNQEKNIPSEDEFIYGAFKSPQLQIATQVSIRSIEAKSGITFGRLAGVDPFETAEEGPSGNKSSSLLNLEQIRFT